MLDDAQPQVDESDRSAMLGTQQRRCLPSPAAHMRPYSGVARGAITVGYFASFFSVGCCLAALGPCLRKLSDSLDVSIDSLGFLFTARATGYLVGSVVGGWACDRFLWTHAPLVLSNLLCALGSTLVPLLGSAPLVAVAVSTQGACMGVLDTGGNVLLLWLWGERVEPFMQAMHFFFGPGAFVSPLLVEASIHHTDDIAWSFYALAVALVLSAAPLLPFHGPRKRPAGEHSATKDDQYSIRSISVTSWPLF